MGNGGACVLYHASCHESPEKVVRGYLVAAAKIFDWPSRRGEAFATTTQPAPSASNGPGVFSATARLPV